MSNVVEETKTIDEYWRDWESHAFGFGYGTGEAHTISALRRFLELCSEGHHGHSYSHEVLERELGPIVTWLLISRLCSVGVIEYGTSPRYAWLSKAGEKLKKYMLSKTSDELYEIATNHTEFYTECYPDACNCGSNSGRPGDQFDENRKCPNPFWERPMAR